MPVAILAPGRHKVVVCRKRGQLVRVSGCLEVSIVLPLEQVADLKLRVEPNFVEVAWEWPDEAETAFVQMVLTQDGEPRPDPQRVLTVQRRDEGIRQDCRFVVNHKKACRVRVEVTPRSPDAADGPVTRSQQTFQIKSTLRGEIEVI